MSSDPQHPPKKKPGVTAVSCVPKAIGGARDKSGYSLAGHQPFSGRLIHGFKAPTVQQRTPTTASFYIFAGTHA